MGDWLLLGADQKEGWVKRILEKRASAVRLDRLPSPEDLEGKELIVEAFPTGDLKEKA